MGGAVALASERTLTRSRAASSSRAGDGARLVGLDVARCLALLGMVATHVLVQRDPDGTLTTVQWLAGGRASALFATLLGVSMALVSGGRTPHGGGTLARDAAALAVRGVLVAALGLWLGGLETGIAVILAYYGVLLWLGLPFLALRARALLVLAVVWAVVVPVVSHLVRPDLAPRRWDSPDLDQLDDLSRLLSELLLTGYYPALAWLAYALLGLGIGRLDLRRSGTALRLLLGGLGVAVGATLVSRAAAPLLGFDRATLREVATGMYGQTPTDDAGWLLLAVPHSTTPLDLLQTGGSAAAVIGLCLLVVGAVGSVSATGERVVAVVFGAGTATLSLYTLHVVMLTETVWPDEGPDSFRWHLLVLLWAGALLVALGRRGPLEWAVGWLPRLIRGR